MEVIINHIKINSYLKFEGEDSDNMQLVAHSGNSILYFNQKFDKNLVLGVDKKMQKFLYKGQTRMNKNLVIVGKKGYLFIVYFPDNYNHYFGLSYKFFRTSIKGNNRAKGSLRLPISSTRTVFFFEFDKNVVEIYSINNVFENRFEIFKQFKNGALNSEISELKKSAKKYNQEYKHITLDAFM